MPSPPTGEVFKGPNYHAGFACSGKMRQRLLHALVALLQMLEKNAAEFGFEADKIEIKVFEALRDINTQAFILQSKINDLLAKDKTLSPEEAEKEAYRWVSPVKNNIPVHTTGAAIDIRLMHQGALIDMGPFGVVWGNDSSAPTFSENLTLTQKMNRLFLHKSVHDVADPNLRLYNYAWEYWHFSIGDRYAQFLEHEDPSLRKAIYGAIHLSKQ